MSPYIWHIKRIEHVGYDEVREFVASAETSEDARIMFATITTADEGPGDEGLSAWLDLTRSQATCLGSSRVPRGVLVRNFAAG